MLRWISRLRTSVRLMKMQQLPVAVPGIIPPRKNASKICLRTDRSYSILLDYRTGPPVTDSKKI